MSITGAILLVLYLAIAVGYWMAFEEKKEEKEHKRIDDLNGMVAAAVLAACVVGAIAEGAYSGSSESVPAIAAAAHAFH